MQPSTFLYRSFLEAKLAISQHSGFAVPADSIHPMLKPHQRDIVRWALLGGRRAVFAAFGLGKSFMQLEIMRQIVRKEGGLQLIIAPLGVRQEFKADAAKLGMGLEFIRRDEEISVPGLYLTNYESVRDGRLHVEHFNAASLDEASVLRSFGSLTYQTFLTLFESVKYRFVATATPSPNRYKELIHYAGFLGVMDTGQALTRFFKRDSTQANNLTLYPHMEREFWLWVNSWAVFLQKPSDLGYSDEGYDLPKLHVHYHKVTTGLPQACDKHGQLQLVDNAAMGLQAASRVKRSSLSARLAKMRDILDAAPGEHCIIWHDQEAERHAIKRTVPTVVDIHGGMDLTSAKTGWWASPTAISPCSPANRSFPARAAIFSVTAVWPSFWASASSSTTSFRPSIAFTASCKSGNATSISFTPMPRPRCWKLCKPNGGGMGRW